MNSEKMESLKTGIRGELEKQVGTLKEHAEHFAAQQVEKMVEQEEAYELSDDEERMLKSYRQFVRSSRPGSVFSWKSLRCDNKILLPTEVSLIEDPSNVSGNNDYL